MRIYQIEMFYNSVHPAAACRIMRVPGRCAASVTADIGCRAVCAGGCELERDCNIGGVRVPSELRSSFCDEAHDGMSAQSFASMSGRKRSVLVLL
ncbi:MAG: hypothetical protein C4B59_07750 [Candidatus Methanogaster sp.]|uniref:Uncharacterized protein n=1 Tax=Candidatus Methanogaster sp. TaxID=3386292 RepID=A0AC61L2T7_9EURY|nr:MAG: hypothetical protein C4B59_07750 [ANME-2 cluster archaeon]